MPAGELPDRPAVVAQLAPEGAAGDADQAIEAALVEGQPVVVDPRLGRQPVRGGARGSEAVERRSMGRGGHGECRQQHGRPPPVPHGAKLPASATLHSRPALLAGRFYVATHSEAKPWPAEMCASLSPSRARTASGATTRPTSPSGTTRIASSCASTAAGVAGIPTIAR